MTNKEKLLLVKFIDIASQEFFNHGCNDVPDNFWNDFTTEEKSALIYDMYLQDDDPEEEFDPECLYVSDWWLMSYLGNKLKEEATNEQQLR